MKRWSSVQAIGAGAAIAAGGTLACGGTPSWIIYGVLGFGLGGEGGRMSGEAALLIADGTFVVALMLGHAVGGFVGATLAPERRFWHGLTGGSFVVAAWTALLSIDRLELAMNQTDPMAIALRVGNGAFLLLLVVLLIVAEGVATNLLPDRKYAYGILAGTAACGAVTAILVAEGWSWPPAHDRTMLLWIVGYPGVALAGTCLGAILGERAASSDTAAPVASSFEG